MMTKEKKSFYLSVCARVYVPKRERDKEQKSCFRGDIYTIVIIHNISCIVLRIEKIEACLGPFSLSIAVQMADDHESSNFFFHHLLFQRAIDSRTEKHNLLLMNYHVDKEYPQHTHRIIWLIDTFSSKFITLNNQI